MQHTDPVVYNSVDSSYEIIKPKKWFRSGFWDSFWIQSAYWIFPLFFGIYFFYKDDSQNIEYLVAGILILVRLGHGYSTTLLCILNPMFQKIAKKRPWEFLGIPAAITIFFIFYFLVPQSIFPYDTLMRMKLYFFVSFPYIYVHYAYQHIGILSIYRSRSGQKLSPFHQKFERYFCHIVTGFILTALNLNNFYDLDLYGWSYAGLFRTDLIDWNTVAWAVVFPMTAWFLYLELKTPIKSIPKIFYGLSTSLMALVLTLDDFIFAWSLLHCQHFVAHFGISGHIMEQYEKIKEQTENKKPFFGGILKQFLLLTTMSVFLSVVHFHYQITGSINGRYDEYFRFLVPQESAQSNLRLFMLGLFVGLGICHYYYDRLAFKMSDKEIGNVIKKML